MGPKCARGRRRSVERQDFMRRRSRPRSTARRAGKSDGRTFIRVACADGWIALGELQIAGKKRLVRELPLGGATYSNTKPQKKRPLPTVPGQIDFDEEASRSSCKRHTLPSFRPILAAVWYRKPVGTSRLQGTVHIVALHRHDHPSPGRQSAGSAMPKASMVCKPTKTRLISSKLRPRASG